MQHLHDPGPCPVDDTPHTACTTPGPLTSRTSIDQRVTVAVARPGWLRAHAPATPPAPEPTVQTFTTATYTRREHGRKSFGKGSRTR